MSMGQISIDLFLKTGSFETDSKKAEARVKGMEKAFTGAANKMAAAVGLTSLSLGGAAAGAIMWANSVTKAGNEIQRLAGIANTSTTEFQKWTHAAKSAGIEQDKLSDILKDVSDKVGEFIATGGGEMKDFFEQIAPKVGVTAEQFSKLGGAESLQLYYNSLQKANLGAKAQTFYMEALANDATALIPLLRNNGEELNRLGQQAESYGLIMNEQAIAASKEFQGHLSELSAITSGYSTVIANEAIPMLNNLLETLIEGTDDTNGLNTAATDLSKNDLATWFNAVGYAAARGADIFVAFKNTVKALGASIATVMSDIDLFDSYTMKVNPFGIKSDEAVKQAEAIYNAKKEANAQLVREADKAWSTAFDSFGSTAIADKFEQKQKDLQTGTNAATKAVTAENMALLENTKAKEKASKAAKEKIALTQAEIKVLQRMQELSYKQNFGDLEKQFNLPKGLLGGVIAQESQGIHKKANGQLLTSPVGAKGYGQFMPDTRKWAMQKGWGDAYKEDEAAKTTAQYLRYLLDKFNGNVKDTVNAYNWGEGRVIDANKRGSDKRPAETNKHWAGVQKWQSLLNGGDGEAKDKQGLVYAEKMRDLAAEYILQQQEQLALIGKNSEAERVLAEIQIGKYGQLSEQQQEQMLAVAQMIDDTQKMSDQQERYNELLEMVTGTEAIANHLADIAMLKDAWEQGKISLEQYKLAVAQLPVPEQLKDPNDWVGGIKEGFNNFVNSAGSMRDQFSSATEGVMNTLGDSLGNFVATGKADFRSMTVSILQDLSKMLIQMAIVQAMKAALGGYKDGGMVQGFSTGGPVWGAGTATSDSIPAMLSHGEFVINAASTAKNRPLLEAINSNRYATGGHVGKDGGIAGGAAMAGGVTVNVTINKDGSSEEKTEGNTENQGRQLGKIISAKVKEVITAETRPGGIIYNAAKR